MSTNQKTSLMDWVVTPIHVVIFFCILTSFHPFLVVTRFLFGEKAMWSLLEIMNLALITNIRITGASVQYINEHQIEKDVPCIFICNHQCMYDIPYIIWFLRKYKPRFISKKELGKGIPSISFALRHGSQLLIDRSDPASAVPAIKGFAKHHFDRNGTIGLFPEGTRARDGVMKSFKARGFNTLIEECPDALLVPMVISGSWRHMQFKFKPVPFGIKVKLKVLKPRRLDGQAPGKFLSELEAEMREELAQLDGAKDQKPPTRQDTTSEAAGA